MQRTANETQSALLQSQMSANDQPTENKNSNLNNRIPIENTPFYLNGNEENGYFITIKNYKVTEEKKQLNDAQTLQEFAEEILKEKMWNIIFHLVIILQEQEKLLSQKEN